MNEQEIRKEIDRIQDEIDRIRDNAEIRAENLEADISVLIGQLPPRVPSKLDKLMVDIYRPTIEKLLEENTPLVDSILKMQERVEKAGRYLTFPVEIHRKVEPNE